MNEKMNGRESILDYLVCMDGFESITDEICVHINNKSDPAYLVCLNPHSYAVSTKDLSFSHALHNAKWNIPDGIGVVWASYILGGCIRKRITGSDIFFGLNEKLNTMNNMKIFMLGSTHENLLELVKRIKKNFPNISVVGYYSPPFMTTFSKTENEKIINIVNASEADVLWVGLSAPKQEKWINDNLKMIRVPFIAAVGAVFDFYTGNIKRSHVIFQSLGLEWLPRLLQEPRRLYKRMFVSAPLFLWHVLCRRLSSIFR